MKQDLNQILAKLTTLSPDEQMNHLCKKLPELANIGNVMSSSLAIKQDSLVISLIVDSLPSYDDLKRIGIIYNNTDILGDMQGNRRINGKLISESGISIRYNPNNLKGGIAYIDFSYIH